MNVENFLAQIANLPGDRVDEDGNKLKSESDNWGSLLDEKVPGWKELVADSANWDALAQSKPKKDRDDLMIMIVEIVGLELANHFIKSRDSEVRAGATRWFNTHLEQFSEFSSEGKKSMGARNIWDYIIHFGQSIELKIWQHLDPRQRNEVIDSVAGEAFRTWPMRVMLAFELHLCGASSAEIRLVMSQHDRDDFPYYMLRRHGYHFYDMSDWPDHRFLEELLNDCRPRTPRTQPPQPRLSPAAALARPFDLPNPEAREPLKALLDYLQSSHDTVSLAYYEVVRAKLLGSTAPIPTLLRPNYSTNPTIPEKVKKWFKQKQVLLAVGEKLPRLPKIEISENDPPAFKENPRLKQRYEEDGEVGLERVDVESLLGAYFGDKKRIVIWRKGVELCSRELRSGYGRPKGLPFEDLFLCVLVHELGHWFNAEAKVANGARWDPALLTLTVTSRHELPVHPDNTTPNASLPDVLKGDARSLSSRSYHEAWAQMFAWLYGQEVDPNVLAAFEALEKMQSAPYQAWRQLVSTKSRPDNGPYTLANLRWDQAHILKSLEWSRSLKSGKTGDALPATYADPSFSSTNMMEWLLTDPRC